MSVSVPTSAPAQCGNDPDTLAEKERRIRLHKLVSKASELLPSQGPITAFVFLNTLQALEDLPFEQGVVKGGKLFGAHPFLTEDRYREKMSGGRIQQEDLEAVLRSDLGDVADEPIGTLGTRLKLRLAMLKYPLRVGPTAELRWFVAETDALRKFRPEVESSERDRWIEESRRWVMRDLRHEPSGKTLAGEGKRERKLHDAVLRTLRENGESTIERWSPGAWEALTLQVLWRVCELSVRGVAHSSKPSLEFVRPRDALLAATGQDTDPQVHEVLIRFTAAFVDQGLAAWELPNRQLGYFGAFAALYGSPNPFAAAWMRKLPEELNRVRLAGMSPLDSLVESLDLLGIDECEWENSIIASLLALKGWAGLLWQMDVRGDRVPTPVPADTVLEYLAVRLILERLALADVAAQAMNFQGPLSHLRTTAEHSARHHEPVGDTQHAFLIFQLAQVLGWHPSVLYRQTRSEWTKLVEEIEAFTGMERRRLFHLAFERRFRTQALDAVSIHANRNFQRVTSPRFQAAFCIDAREESFRRHLEEVSPDVETFGTAGFYGVAMYYRGVADAHYAALCPIVVRPQHWVTEEVVYTLEDSHRRRKSARRAIGTATHHVHLGTRGIARGALLTAGLGVLASIPLVARVLFPGKTARIRKSLGRFVQPPPITRLRLERQHPTPGPTGDQIGYTIEEMAFVGEKMLREMGLTHNFARLVIFLGHGSFCMNNPHKSAYDCGACSGSAGGPNARALAMMLNDVRVREILAKKGLSIPSSTLFLGGLHNTGNDTITFSDLDLLPKSHTADFESARETLAQACARNAQERCRRFYSAPLEITPSEAIRHVEDRVEDLAQTRPEYGNATNAICIVGRRERLRGLYLDRRSFLTSYDATQDDSESTILGRILGAVVPVCEGINLQYYFSYVDSPGWACGTKLPHNVTSLLGVMDGAQSDLRPGLPLQGVEIHEPVRLLFVIEAKPSAIRAIMGRNPTVNRIISNGWVQLALLNPDSNEILLYQKGEFVPFQPSAIELPKAKSSHDWYRGWREHLGFAQIGDGFSQ